MLNTPTIFVYFFYSIVFCTSFCALSRDHNMQKLGVGALIVLAPFQITTFFQIGFDFSYFELSLLLLSIIFSLRFLTAGKINFHSNSWIKISMTFLGLVIFSIFIAAFRRGIGELVPIHMLGSPIVNSLTASGRFLFYTICLLIIYNGVTHVTRLDYWKYIALAGVMPTIALLYQYFVHTVPLSLLANNATYAMNGDWITFAGYRPLAFTAELTFYCYFTLFSLIGALHVFFYRSLTRLQATALIILLVYGILLAASRMGVLAMLVILAIHFFKVYGLRQAVMAIGVVVILGVIGTSPELNQIGLQEHSNTFDRLLSLLSLSPTNIDVDESTFVRGYNTLAVWQLFMEKSLVFGVGYFNYNYYADLLDIDKNSYSTLVQLLAEFGLLPLLLLPYVYFIKVKPKISHHEKLVFINIVIYAISGSPFHSPLTYLLLLAPRAAREQQRAG